MSSKKTISFPEFVKKNSHGLTQTSFHKCYYEVLDQFAHGKIRKLIITMPPQHGKSVGASTFLPAYILGLNPDSKVAITSYSASLASRFNRRVQRIIESSEYSKTFPETTIKTSGSGKQNYVRTSDQAEIINHTGEVMSVGREGALTGNQVDIFIIDDLYKDAMEANSPVIRENCWEWYISVVKTRMHNNSSELIVFTRWHEEDLIGKIAEKEHIEKLERWDQIDNISNETWLHLHFEALKESVPTEIDPRIEGEALWPERHSRELLLSKRQLNPVAFEALYQGKPSNKDGLLYSDGFKTYSILPKEIVRSANYTDTADTGDDYLCSICYVIGIDGMIYITDIVYSQEKMEVTEKMVADMIELNMTRDVLVESNNGGRGFARAVGKIVPMAKISWFHQSANKEARILSNSATVLNCVVMPADWTQRWSDFYRHITTYRRIFRTNRWHDAADVLTGIIEKEVAEHAVKKIRAMGFSSGR